MPNEETKYPHQRKYYLKNREAILAKAKERYQNDADFREKAKETYRKRYHEDPEYRQRTIDNAKARYRRLKELADRAIAAGL